jgi:hypothetical protein
VMSFIAFMSGPWGRALRSVGGLALVTLAWSERGRMWLVAVPGVAMTATGIMNYCPALALALATPKAEQSELMSSLGSRNLFK